MGSGRLNGRLNESPGAERYRDGEGEFIPISTTLSTSLNLRLKHRGRIDAFFGSCLSLPCNFPDDKLVEISATSGRI